MHLDRRRFPHPQEPIVAEIRLANAAAVDRDVAVQCGAQAVDHPALHLRLRAARVHDRPAVHRRHDPMDPNPPRRVERDLGDVRGVAAEREMRGDSAPSASRERPAPARPFGGQAYHSGQPSRVEHRPPVVGVPQLARLTKHGEPELDRIPPRKMRELVHRALDHERVRRMQRRPPGPHRNDGGDQRVLHSDVRQALRRKVVGVELGLHRIRPIGERIPRRVREMLRPRDRRTRRIDGGAHAVHPRRSVVVVLQIVLPCAHDLDGSTRGLRQERRLGRIIHHETSTESTTRPLDVHGDVRAGYSDDLGHERLRVTRILRRPPQLDAITAHVGGVVDRLHRNVRDERNLVDDVHGLCGRAKRAVDVAVVADALARTIECAAKRRRERRRRCGDTAAVVPRDVEHLASLERGPRMVREHRDPFAETRGVVEWRYPNDAPHARHRERARVVDSHDARAEWRVENRRHEHSRARDVDAEPLRSARDRRRVGVADSRADEAEGRARLERYVRRHLHGRSLGRQLAVIDPTRRRVVNHDTGLGATRRRIDIPPRRRGTHECPARRRAHASQRHPVAADAGTPADELAAEPPIERRLDDAHLLPRDVELFGDDHGE